MRNPDEVDPELQKEADAQLTRDMAFLDAEFRRVVERECLVTLHHDRASLLKLDELFGGRLRALCLADFRSASFMLGAYLGETIKRLAGGRWSKDEAFGPALIEVPHVPGVLRVVARAERRIQSNEGGVLIDFMERTAPLRH